MKQDLSSDSDSESLSVELTVVEEPFCSTVAPQAGTHAEAPATTADRTSTSTIRRRKSAEFIMKQSSSDGSLTSKSTLPTKRLSLTSVPSAQPCPARAPQTSVSDAPVLDSDSSFEKYCERSAMQAYIQAKYVNLSAERHRPTDYAKTSAWRKAVRYTVLI